ncbi:MAG: CDP-alcohol phosphatidyltransferase family protein [Woeseiaceae bacterium]
MPASKNIPARNVANWVNWHAVAMSLSVAAVYLLHSSAPVGLAALLSFSFLLLHRWQYFERPAVRRRYAHQLTLIRLMLLCYAAFRINDIDWTWLLAIFTTNVLLDVIDGIVARRFAQSSDFGTTFDREVDGLYVLVACLYFDIAGGIGAWILIPGLLPYGYRLIVWMTGAPANTSQKQSHAAILAGLNFVLLLIAVAAPPNYRLIVLVISATIVTLSFLISFWMLFRRRDANSVF